MGEVITFINKSTVCNCGVDECCATCCVDCHEEDINRISEMDILNNLKADNLKLKVSNAIMLDHMTDLIKEVEALRSMVKGVV